MEKTGHLITENKVVWLIQADDGVLQLMARIAVAKMQNHKREKNRKSYTSKIKEVCLQITVKHPDGRDQPLLHVCPNVFAY